MNKVIRNEGQHGVHFLSVHQVQLRHYLLHHDLHCMTEMLLLWPVVNFTVWLDFAVLPSNVIAIGYGLDGQGLIPGSGKIIVFYSTESWQDLEPTHPHIQ
jgi:hypothetical protein